MLINQAYLDNLVHVNIVSFENRFGNMLDKNCRYCGIKLTQENARKRKGVKSGFRPECKICRNKYERRNTRKKQCEYCGIYCIAKGKRSFCSIIYRFKAYCTIDSKTGCWEWRQKWRKKDGYGSFTIVKKQKRAHRVSFELFKGEIPPGLFVCHSCDNPPCVNPDHLWVGTNQDNQLDYQSKLKDKNGFK